MSVTETLLIFILVVQLFRTFQDFCAYDTIITYIEGLIKEKR